MFVNWLPFPTKNELVIGVLEAFIPDPVTDIIPDPDMFSANHSKLPSISGIVSFDPLTALNINGIVYMFGNKYVNTISGLEKI